MKAKSWKYGALLITILSAATAGRAISMDGGDHPPKQITRRVESITLAPATWTLHWTTSRGEIRNGQYIHTGKIDDWEIAFPSAEMSHDGVTLKFSEEEAKTVQRLMAAIVVYAAESVEWFEQQQQATQAQR